MNRASRQAHPDPDRRYLAHRDRQPVERWNELLQIGLFLVGLLGILLVLSLLSLQAPA